MRKNYGEKRDYRKIDLYCMGQYVASTTWAKSLLEARQGYKETYPKLWLADIQAEYSK